VSGVKSLQNELNGLKQLLEALEWMGCQPHVARHYALRKECRDRAARLMEQIAETEKIVQAHNLKRTVHK
jgi:hypothetical protein